MQVNGIIRLTKDPVVRKTHTGETVVNFDAAWNYGETGHFIRCVRDTHKITLLSNLK